MAGSWVRFRPGDEVQARADGPRMVVCAVGWRDGVPLARCAWFDGRTTRLTEFPATSLRPAAPAPPARPAAG